MLKFHAKVVVLGLSSIILWCLELPTLWRQQNGVLEYYAADGNDGFSSSVHYKDEQHQHQAIMDESLKATSMVQVDLFDEPATNSRESTSSLVNTLDANERYSQNQLQQQRQYNQSTVATTTSQSDSTKSEETPHKSKDPSRHSAPSLQQYQVPKTHFSNYCRFLFIAGLGGTGHHGWQTVLNKGRVCRRSKRLDKALYNLWWGPDDQADVFAIAVKEAFGEAQAQAYQHWQTTNTTTVYCLNTMAKGLMYSYPKSNKPRHHPNVYTLALLAESTVPPVDLRLIVIHRAPTTQLVSLSIHRHFEALPKEAQQMSNQAALLNAQLQLLDPAFFQCRAYDEVAASQHNRDLLQHHVLGGLLPAPSSAATTSSVGETETDHDGSTSSSPPLLAQALETYYKARPDNTMEALQKIVKFRDGRNIMLKIDEMDMYRRYLTQEICVRSNPKDKDLQLVDNSTAVTTTTIAEPNNSLATIAAVARDTEKQRFTEKPLYWIGNPKIVTNVTSRIKREFLNVAKMHQINQQRALESLDASTEKLQNHKDHQVLKTQFSEYCRFLFVAGLGGAGHAEWGKAMTGGGETTLSSKEQQDGIICERSPEIEKALQKLWWGKDHSSDKHAASLQTAMLQAQDAAMKRWQATNQTTVYCLNTMTPSTHFSYPGSTSILQQKHHPNAHSLALLAESVSVDLRIVVLHRHAAALLLSNRTAISSGKEADTSSLPISSWAQILTNQAAMLNSQLDLLDPAFFICSEVEKVTAMNEEIYKHIFGAMAGGSSDMITLRNSLGNSFTSMDNNTFATALIRQQSDGVQFGFKIDEIEVYRQHLAGEICKIRH